MRYKLLFVLAALFLFASFSIAAANGQIRGVVTDSKTGEPLPGANITIEGSSIGAATSLEGEYIIPNVPPGTYTLIVNFIGYERKTRDIQIQPKERLTEDFELTYKVIEGEEVTITAQAEGQLRAINQQLRSNTIVNVVSSERIRELPDDNAAESVGRLPGVAIRRSGGEGQRVNIRGMSPKYNSITIDGERIPATSQGRRLFYFKGAGGGSVSTTTEDRSVDLSVISSEALGGIEVYKALTPEQDADAIGGSVNFVTRKAPQGLNIRANALGAYTGYHDSFENAKTNASISNRFLDNKLGVLLAGSFQRADRSRDVQAANWILRGAGVVLSNVDLDDTIELRDRYTVNLNLDYELSDRTDIMWTNMYSRTDREIINRQYRLSLIGNDGDYNVSWNQPSVYVYSSNLRFNHSLSFADVDWGVNYITTVDENDFNYGFSFSDPGVFQSTSFVENEGPYAASNAATFRESANGGVPWGGGESERNDKNWSAQLNVQRPFTLGSSVNGYVKIGGKYRYKDRNFTSSGLKGRGVNFLNRFTADNPDFKLSRSSLAISNFLGAYDPGDFFYGDHPFPITLPHETPYNMFQDYRDIWKPRIADGLNNYNAQEAISAGYFQTELNLGKRVTFLGGVRYEHIQNDYVAIKRTDITEDYFDETREDLIGSWSDTTSSRGYGEWFPQFHLRYQVLKSRMEDRGLDLRLAYTRTISRPDFLLISPRYYQSNSKRTIERGRPDLEPTTSWNYDLTLTAYSKLGLFSVGGFYKDLENVSFEYVRQARESDGIDNPLRWIVVDPINSTEDNKVYGMELELQTNTRWLPSPFDGIVLYGNYSLFRSEVNYPWTFFRYDPATFSNIRIDSSRINQLPGQANQIVNVSIGYDRGPFSSRLSYYFQDETLDWIGENEEIDGWVDAYDRLDFAATYRITSYMTAVVNVSNIFNSHDRTFIGVNNLTGSEAVYGSRTEFGLRFNL